MKKFSSKLSRIPFLTILLVTFSVAVWAQPTLTFSPLNAAVGVAENIVITISSNEDLDRCDNTNITDANVDALITLKRDNAAGANIPFNAVFDDGVTNRIISITPNSILPSNTVIFVEISCVEGSGNADIAAPQNVSFTTGDTQTPTIVFNPLNTATGVSVSGNLTITFDEAVRRTNDAAITAGDLLTLVELKLTSDAGAPEPFTASIDGTNRIITVNPTSNLASTTVYYLEINPVEDATDHATTAANITFTTADVLPPVLTFTPLNSATGVLETADITISFNEAIRRASDDVNLDDATIDARITLKLTNAVGANIPFDATINGGDNLVTINPTAILPSNTVIYVAIVGVEDASNNLISPDPTSITFTTGDTQPPTIVFNPLNTATGVSVSGNLTITFDEAVRKTDDAAITAGDLLTLVELKLTSDGGAPEPFTASIDGTNRIITVNPTSNLASTTVYYLEINPVEDITDHATTATNITFTTADVLPPVLTFTPLNSATGVLETADVTISFNEAIRRASDDVNLDDATIDARITLKLTNAFGANIPFDATINVGDNLVTINPTATLPGNTVIYVAIVGVEDASNNLISPDPTSITFTTGDTQPPSVVFNPLNSATNFSAVGNITLTFNEAIRKTDNSAILAADIEGGLVELKLTNNGGAPVPFTATINGANTIITINPNATLASNQVYYVEMNIVEDGANNATTASSITFTTETRPSITSFAPGSTCIGDNVTITGLRFEGTGNPVTGTATPTVTINGVAISALNIVSHNATQVVFTVPPTATTGPITVRNNNSDLVSANSASDLTVYPAIDQTLAVTPATLSPAQNTSVNVLIDNAQNGFTYDLTLTAAPAPFVAFHTLTLPDIAHQATGTGVDLILNTSEGADPDFTHIGDYDYEINVSRTGCTTKTLNATSPPITLTVASLAANVFATSTSICAGNSSILIGQTSGGTGFYQFSWSGPNSFTDNSSSPTIFPAHPAGTGWYVLTLTDNSANEAKDSVFITTNPSFAVSFQPVGGAPSVQTEYTNQNQLFELNGSPSQLISAGATFSGPGVVALSDSNKYYFNPQLAANGVHTITYSFNNGTCVNSTTLNFRVSSTFISNLDPFYCENAGASGDLTLSGSGSTYLTTYYPTYTFTRFRFLKYTYDAGLGYYVFNYYDSTIQPQLEPLYRPNPGGQPNMYRLNVTELVANHGIEPPNAYYYIAVFGADASKLALPLTYPGYVDEAILYNYFRVVPLGLPPNILGITDRQNVCSNATSIPLTQSVGGYTINSFAIPPPYAAAISGNTFNPGHASLTGTAFNDIPLTVTLNYDDYNGCTNTVSRNFNWVKKPAAPTAPNVEYCQITTGLPGSFTIDATRNGPATNPYWYELDPNSNPTTPVLDSINFRGFVAPAITGLVPLVKTFFVTQNNKGCEGDVTPVDITIKAAPNATFIVPSICDNRVFTFTGPLDVTLTPYTTYAWTFGDGQDSVLTDNNLVDYNYGVDASLKPAFSVGLTVTNSLGCINNSVNTAQVNPNPKPDFTHRFVCDLDLTEFNATSTIPGSQFTWDFGDGSPLVGPGAFQNTTHQFNNAGTGVGDYTVKVTATTPQTCFNTDSTTVTILDFLTHTTLNPYDMASLGGGDGLWKLNDIAGNSTWNFILPTAPDTVMRKFTTPAWVTNGAGDYNPGEESVINSPCFDISGVERPVISMDFIMKSDRDGLVLEWSKNGGVNWAPLGGINSGSNWFNASVVVGNSIIGWAGNSRDLADNLVDRDTLVQVRRALDNIGPLSQTDRQNVRFRMAFKSNLDVEDEGFGFNNLRIESRNRISLVENFTNENDPDFDANDTGFKTFDPIETATLQYHLGYPGNDDNYPVNTADPSARAAFYGIPLTDQYLPRGYVDGASGGGGNFSNLGWATTRIAKQGLKTSPYKLTAITLASTDLSYLKVSVTVDAEVGIPGNERPILHIAAVEKTVNTIKNNEFVVRKLIPSAIGTMLTTPMVQGTTITIVDSVRLENPLIDVTDLALIAFVQDENTREVYQAILNLTPGPLPDPGSITGIENPAYADKISLFPNPANHAVTIQLPAAVTKNTPVAMFDTYGRTVYQNTLSVGEQTKSINTTDMTGGVYIMQIGTPDGGVARRKIMVVHP